MSDPLSGREGEPPPGGWTFKREERPAPPAGRLVGYLVPLVVFAALGAGLLGGLGAYAASRGTRRDFETPIEEKNEHVETVVKRLALGGALFGGLIGLFVARKSEQRGGRSLG